MLLWAFFMRKMNIIGRLSFFMLVFDKKSIPNFLVFCAILRESQKLLGFGHVLMGWSFSFRWTIGLV